MVFETDGAIVMYGRKDKGLWEFGFRKKERPWERCLDIIKMGLTQIIFDFVNWVYMGEYLDKCRAAVSTVMYHRRSKEGRNFLTS